MAQRPYFKKSIQELEALFAQSDRDPAILDLLKSELRHRRTQRAQTLAKKVSAASGVAKPIETQAQSASRKASPAARPAPPETKQATSAPLPVTAKRADLGPKPPVTNGPESILRAWTALEVLSPQGYRREADLVAGETARIARFDERGLPWEHGERSRPKKRLYYELILGAIALAPAFDALLKLYADRRPDAPSMQGYSPLASVLLDKDGKPLDDDVSFVVSSFAWGVPVALQGDLKALAAWPQHERDLRKNFSKRLIKKDDNGEVVPLTKAHIANLYEYLVGTLNLSGHTLREPYFALRRYEFYASKTPPEPGLLNSFFLEDLATARELYAKGAVPHSLRYYLGIQQPAVRTDLLEDESGLQHILQPALTPLGRWPGNGRFPLAMLQQAAVNATQAQCMDTGILAVNGPPGTGKTTLLRDVVAARIVERASAMASYKKPSDAFTPTRQTLQRGGAKITLHELNKRLKGYEMVVASSNNKAVENVSAELPVLDAIADDARELRYFKAVSDNILERDSWGVIAAVLGNSSNRYLFSQGFWRDEENGLSTYLNHACGLPQVVSEPQEDGPPKKRNRHIIDREHPPSNQREALKRWEAVRTDFASKLKASEASQAKLQKIHNQVVHAHGLRLELDGLASEILTLEDECPGLEAQLAGAQKRHDLAKKHLMSSRENEASHRKLRPGFFARLFGTARFRNWKTGYQDIGQTLRQSEALEMDSRKALETLCSKLSQTRNEVETKRGRKAALEGELVALEEHLAREKDSLSSTVPDTSFFGLPHEDIQQASIWFGEAENRIREDLFEAAIRLHRAFVDGAADPLRQNLSIFVESFGTRSLGTPQKDALIGDLWASFFLVVPVVSTTFASVHRMFSRLEPETLGWLLIDEAGQALPQAAVGAIMRTKKSVVVGDPLQIEPVVTLPNTLTEEICGYFGIDPLKYNAPEASVQTMADAASIYCARFPIGSGHRDVGAPLLVHRRCDSPMFDISNEIAYANLMVQAKRPLAQNPVLGRSCWIDIAGKPGPDKWCADEAKALIDILQRLRSAGEDADLYIVTPFVIVQNNLRQELLKSSVLKGWVDKSESWVWEHVGTVHTVQGREAKIVFFVLGAQEPSQNGARAWAGARPNLVNVAVTRAQASLYVIGNRSLWKSAGIFSTLNRYL
ncbi:DEAD/DEAH box helicase [Pelagibius sp.]|uniref:DEAD/DEAH box helicase n=1 Tax=Pelagibius sp. TaxID=1931238 RepID=UPI002602EA18|nr:AAA domain-containing protein [Pelagibius sp.]